MVATVTQLNSTHTNRRTRATARAAVLSALKDAFPGAVDPDRLFAIAGRPYPSRIGELREAGWDIKTGPEAMPSYRLASLTRGEADPMTWGLRARVGPRTGLVVSEMSTGRVRLPPDRLARLLARVEAVLREELTQAGVDLGLTATVKSQDPYVLFGEGREADLVTVSDDLEDLYDFDLGDLDLDEEDDDL